jgi:hypothetical protein
MKFSEETLTALKNFSEINNGLQFKAGNKLTTMSATRSVLAQAELKDEFPVDFCVYDLNEFLQVYNLYKDTANVEFDDMHVIFRAGRNNTKYRMTDKEMIVTPPEKGITFPTIDCSFSLSAENCKWLLDTAKVLSSPNIAIQSDGETIEAITFNANDDSAHVNTFEIGEGNGMKYKITFKTENLKLIPGGYDVDISFKGFGHFKNTNANLQYWIAFEAKDSVTKQGE